MFSISKLVTGLSRVVHISPPPNTLLLETSIRLEASSLLVPSKGTVRYRYFEDKPKVLMRKYGYKDKMDFKGPLPRIPTGMPLPMPLYQPKKNWTEKKALFGQNDYIDILGDQEGLKPIMFQTHIPQWLKGFHGNEFQMLIRKHKMLGNRVASRPQEWHNLRKRIKYLYRFLNYNTKSFMDKKVLRR